MTTTPSPVGQSDTDVLMNAVQIDAWGGPEQVNLRQVARPEPGPGQVLVRVKAASVNAVDRRVREGYINGHVALPYTGGSDFSGIVEAAGEGADIEPGTPVFGALHPTSGSYAQFTVYETENLALKPEGMSFEVAAALPVAGVTAWTAVVTDGQVQAGQRVLVQGAAGGVGHLAVQLAKQRGATVIATATPADFDFVRSLGADEVIDYNQPGYATSITDLDLVIDGVSSASMAALYSAIRPGGLAISLFDPPAPAPAGIRAQIVGTAAVAAGPLRTKLEELARLVTHDGLRVVVSASYPLDQVAQAQEAPKRGKAVITP